MKRQQSGAALAITLILLASLSALALTATAAAMAALALAGHQQSAQQAFEAAEAGIAHALALAARTRSGGVIARAPSAPGEDDSVSFEARTTTAAAPGALPVGFSVGEYADNYAAQHYFIVADGRAGRGARATIEQGFYLVVPGSGP
ncbi:MAG: PilX N-terminal domain-containing pilus assembly protein [Gammaproteobacteria bacterium]